MSKHATPQPLLVIFSLCLSLRQKMSPVLSLPAASWCPRVPSPLRAAPTAHSLLGELGPWPQPHQHLCLSRAIFSCWPRGYRGCKPNPAGLLASPASGKMGCGVTVPTYGTGLLFSFQLHHREVAGDQPWSEPPWAAHPQQQPPVWLGGSAQ